ncbi:unnamed protein product [Auanema sp. JU1783]|nr:unnamed protein product [Auanema sp. JU1783]
MECESDEDKPITEVRTARKRFPDDVTNLPEIPQKRDKKGQFNSRFSSVSVSTASLTETDIATEVAGRIAGIEIENFMCHSNLQINFDVKNKNCFYIGGSNGSGKSAVFAAFNLGLGGKGSHNDRGNSVKGYIKSGKQRAKIRITLTNRGQGAIKSFAQRNLGQHVIIERSINHTQSTYTLKTSDGVGNEMRERVFSNKKSDLDVILSKYNIQLTNPIFWMSQDRSRQFLQGWDPLKMFNMFMDSTGLSVALRTYEEIENSLKELKTNQKICNELVREKKEEFQKIINLRSQTQKVRQLRTNLLSLHWMACWTPLRDYQRDFEEVESALDNFEKNKSNLRTVLKEVAEEKEAKAELNEKIRKEMKVFSESTKVFVERKKNCDQQMRDLNHKVIQIENDHERLRVKYENQMRTITRMETEVSDVLTKKGVDENAEKIQEANRSLELLTEQEQVKVSEKVKFRQDWNEVEKRKQSNDSELAQIKQKGASLVSKLKMQESLLRDSEGRSSNQMFRFGEHTSKILEVIRSNRHLFDMEPKGPIGMYVSVLDKKWAFAVEEVLRANLKSFLIDSKKDLTTFRKLLNKYRIPVPNTLVTRFVGEDYDVRRSEPSSDYPTVYRMIEVKDVDVRNALIDSTGIESIILIESDQEARRLMDGHAPQNASRAITSSGGTAYSHPYRFYACQKTPKPTILDEDQELCDFEKVRSEIADLKKQLEQCSAVRSKLENQDRKLHKENEYKRRLFTSCEEEMLQIQTQIRECRTKIDMFVDDTDNDEVIGNLRNSIAAYHDSCKKIKEEQNTLQNKRAALQEEFAGLEREQLVIEEDQAELEKKSEKLRQSFQSIKAESDALEGKYQEAKDQLDSAEVNHMDLATKRKNLLTIEKAKAERFAETAKDMPVPEGFSNPPDFDKLPASSILNEEVENIETEIKREEKIQSEMSNQIERKDELIDDAMFAHFFEDFKTFKRSIKMNREIASKLAESLRVRKENFPLLQHVIIQRLQSTFKDLMLYCKFNGEIEVDTRKRRLNVRVSRKESGESQTQPALQDMKGLSGGERSYTTACLIMALWAIMDHPFRCMDEFDVFMDMINRKIIMNLLVELATVKYPHNQFIFFTPQGIRELDDKDRVDIFTMQKPRTG